MSRLNKHLNESRSTPITRGQLREYLEGDFSDAAKNLLRGEAMYRGSKMDYDYALLDPHSNIRKSANTSNHYTLFINNHKSWDAFPRRQVIGTSSGSHANMYGNLYIVLPENGAKIGICPSVDIWDSFNDMIEKYSTYNHEIDTLEEFNGGLESLGIPDDSYIKMRNKADDVLWDSLKNMTAWEVMEDVLDPKKNGFKLSFIKNMKLPNNNEVWTDARCLMVHKSQEEILDDIVQELYRR